MKPRRKKYFINKRYQSEFVLKFCVFVAIGCLVFGLFLYMFSGRTLTTSFENSRLVVKSTADYLLPGLVFGGLIVALIMAIAVSFQIVLMTHKVAGPMYRFEKYAELVASGELSSNLKIRKKDQFQNVVVSFNKMVGNLSKGLSQVMGVSDRLSTLIDKLSEHSRGEILLEEDIRNVVGELKENKQNLKKALSYFKVKK